MATLFLVIGAFISPIMGIIFLLISLFRNYKPTIWTTIILTAIIALIGIYWFPWGDNQSHFFSYLTDNVDFYLSEPAIMMLSTYWLYDWVIRLIADLTGNYVYGYYFWLFFPLAIYSCIVWSSYMKNNTVSKNYVIPFFVLFAIIGIREFLDLNRSTSVSLILIAALFLIQGKKCSKVISVLLFIVAFYLHDMMRLLIILLPITYLMIKKINSKVTWYSIAFVLAALSTVIQTIVLPHIMSERNQELYLEGAFGMGSGVNSGYMILMGWINVILTIVLYYYIITKRQYIKNKLVLSLFIASSLVVFSCFGLWTIRERFSILCILSATSLMVSEWDTFASNLLLPKLMIGSIIVKFILIIFLHYSALFIYRSSSNDPDESVAVTSRIFYVPTPLLIDVNMFGYNDNVYLKLYDRAKYGN